MNWNIMSGTINFGLFLYWMMAYTSQGIGKHGLFLGLVALIVAGLSFGYAGGDER